MNDRMLKSREACEFLDLMYNGRNKSYLNQLAELGLIKPTSHGHPKWMRSDMEKVKQWIIDSKISLKNGNLGILDESILNEIAA